MGAKTQANAKDSNEKRPELRCDDCERDFLNIAALKSHTMAKHPEKYKLMLNREANIKDEKKTAFVPPTSRVSRRLQQKKSVDKDVTTETKTVESRRRIVFQCPKCLKEFSVLFPANKHIQNRHCEDKDGNPVSADSPDLIKPIRKEICTECDKLYHGNQPCGESSNTESNNGMYSCLACKEVFASVAIFDEHVESNHDESVGVVILGNTTEFQNWKSKVELKQRVKYLTLSNTTQKQYYQCNYVSPQNSAHVTHLCPSVMIVREFSKGIHVRFYKEHYEHVCEKYNEPNDNKKAVQDHNKEYAEVLKSGVDVYTKLKDLLKSIAQQASTVNRTKLKPLYISALEMQAYLNSLKSTNENTTTKPVVKNNVEKAESVTVDQNNIDNETKSKKIVNDNKVLELEGTRASARLKRKTGSSPASGPKNKVPKNRETNTESKENNAQIDLACPERFESPKSNIASPFTQSPSFNDTYKQFIDSKADTLKLKKPKKEIVKTKIGQFTPSPKKTVQFKEESENVSSKKKNKAPAKTTPLKDLKLEDVEYEVVEQENDCNILILKI